MNLIGTNKNKIISIISIHVSRIDILDHRAATFPAAAVLPRYMRMLASELALFLVLVLMLMLLLLLLIMQLLLVLLVLLVLVLLLFLLLLLLFIQPLLM